MNTLLPPNATQLERLAAEALTQIEQVPVPMRELVNPDLCPAQLLPHLGWAFSVDRWDSAWSETTKRQVIKASYYVHAHKGTLGALRRVVEPLGYLIEVVEWWQTEPNGPPGTFALKVGVLDSGITEPMYELLSWLIDDAKPLSRHMTGLAISLETIGQLSLMASAHDGEELDVYPPQSRDIEVGGAIGITGHETSLDLLDVYP
ncbi:phage tail protein I [Pseudomonas sp. RIT-PI-S]|uniref:phage tail protein I n=1 Tax=Pseudomonas sp. RIT-PI-S TaxID=3035295 RepID=UPI0021DAAEAB|nr:phage tail protein I [Pseudomonas sp. RIT-PI-S]